MTAHQEAQIAVAQLRGLRKLADSGMRVRRAEVLVLNRLSDEALAIVAAEFVNQENATELKGTENASNKITQ
jgi:hypothetical protein